MVEDAKMATTVTTLLLVIVYMSDYSLALRDKNERLVATNQGLVRPKPEIFNPENLNHHDVVFTYLGIPYAAPPLEERRFAPPAPVDPWEGILNGTTLPSPCPQIREPGFEFSEDCLYLNVYVPGSERKNARPVMIFIHGGGLESGSGSDLSGVALASVGDVIVVTINYRLNIFGFLTTGDSVLPPNLGLLDQRRALQWVYQNIEAFGGDPGQITIFGESAGAASVGWHILSDGSRKYFQRAILQSGVPLNPWARLNTLEEVQEWIGVISGLGQCGDSDVAQCLKEKTEAELLTILGTVRGMFPTASIFVPFVDGDFFASDIGTLLQNGSYRDIDILLGTTRDEGTSFTLAIAGNPIERPFVPKSQFAFVSQSAHSPLLTDLYETVYADNIDETGNYEGALSTLIGDSFFTCGVNDFARKVADAGSKVDLYRVIHVPMKSVTNRDWLGVPHTEDLQFVFGLPLLYPDIYGQSLPDVKFSFYVIQYWANFAKYGDPNMPYPLPRDVSEWPKFNSQTEMYKELDINFSDGQKLRQHHCNFLDNLLPQVVYLADVAAGESQD